MERQLNNGSEETEGRTIKLSTKISFGIGESSIGMMLFIFGAFTFFFYNQVMNLSGTLCGIAVSVSMIMDGITDPLVGSISVRYRSKSWGRRHPFMMAAILPMAATIILTFSPPAGFSETGLFIWLMVFAVSARAAMTLFLIPASALGAEMTTNYHERTSIFAFGTIATMLGVITTSVIAYKAFFAPTESFENGLLNPDAYLPFALFSAIMILITTSICIFGTKKEIPYLVETKPAEDRFNILKMLKDCALTMRNYSFRYFFFAAIFFGLVTGTRDTISLHMQNFFWELVPEQISYIMISLFFSMITAAALTKKVSSKIDKKPTLILGILASMSLFFLPTILRLIGFFPENHSPYLLPSLCFVFYLAGAFGGMGLIIAPSMIADMIDEYDVDFQKRQEGIFYSARAIVTKAATGLGTVFAGLAIDYINFPKDAKPGEVGQEVLWKLGFFESAILGIFVLMAAWLYSKYNITHKKHLEHVEILRKRRELLISQAN